MPLQCVMYNLWWMPHSVFLPLRFPSHPVPQTPVQHQCSTCGPTCSFLWTTVKDSSWTAPSLPLVSSQSPVHNSSLLLHCKPPLTFLPLASCGLTLTSFLVTGEQHDWAQPTSSCNNSNYVATAVCSLFIWRRWGKLPVTAYSMPLT